MKRDLILPEDVSAGLLFASARAYCLDDSDVDWLGEAMGTWHLPESEYVGIVFNNDLPLRRRIMQELDLSCVQMLYFHNPFPLFFDDLLADLSRLERDTLNASPDDEDCRLLSALHGLRAINLTESKISDNGLKMLCELQSLESLAVSCTGITDSGLDELIHLIDLRELDLSLTAVSDDGLLKLSSLRTLEELRLASTGISEEGIVHLLKLQKLKLLDVADTAITEEGIAILQAGLGTSQIVF
jgi:hypothetical protein